MTESGARCAAELAGKGLNQLATEVLARAMQYDPALPKMGHRLYTPQKELEKFTLSVAVGQVQFDDIAAWFKKWIAGDIPRGPVTD